MRKTIIPAAIVLAAPAVTMQAQELTFEGIQKEISAVSTEIGTYPKAVQDMFSPELSKLENDLRKVRDNAEMSDGQKKNEYAEISGTVATVKQNAAAKEKQYADKRDAALKAIADAKTAYSTAESIISNLEVPSVCTDYSTQLTNLAKPTEPTSAELYESIELSTSTASAWGRYESSIATLVDNATSADQAEMDAQLERQTALESSIKTVTNQVNGKLSLVQSYLDYTGKDTHETTISGVIDEAKDLSDAIASSLTAWELTTKKVTEYKTAINELQEKLENTVEAAGTAALAKAKEGADALVSGLTEYVDFGPDDFTKTAKEAANTAIAKAKIAAETLAIMAVEEDYNTYKPTLEGLVSVAETAKKDVAPLVNNHTAYADLKATHETLKAAYDAAAIDLSTLKAQSKIDDQFYNEANDKLNVVAQNLEKLHNANEGNYKDKKYTEGKIDADYTAAKALLGDVYTTADAIKQIVTDATGYQATLAIIEGYKTRISEATVTVSFSEENEQYADNYQEQAKTLNAELIAQKTTAENAVQALEEDFRANKVLDTTVDSKVSSAVKALEGAAAEASADLNAYVSSKETLAGWTATVKAILDKLPLPETISDDYDDKSVLVNDRNSATNYQTEIGNLGTATDNAFKASPRTSQDVWQNIQGKTYTKDLSTLDGTVDDHLGAYKKWLDAQGDAAAYKLGVKYYTELQKLLDAAITATAPTANGFNDDQKAIDALKEEVDKHTDKVNHKFNDCIAAMNSWKEKYVQLKTDIETHKQAYITNGTKYTENLAVLDGILTEEAKQRNLYSQLSQTNKDAIDAEIADAKKELDQKKKDQDAASYNAENAKATIFNHIAEKLLKEKLDASGVAAALNSVSSQLKTDGWNPNNVFSTKLAEYQSEYDNFTNGVQYSGYDTNGYDTKYKRIKALESGIYAVAEAAKANYDAYTKQKKAQTDAKATWANIYSSVGATYGDQFPSAQKRYQDKLNECFEKLNGYDTTIEDNYNAGTSTKFNSETYNKAIAENEANMKGIEKAAKDNKTAYDDQMKKFTTLGIYYSEQQTALQTQIENVVTAIGGATDADKENLKAQKDALDKAKEDLLAVQTSIKDLEAAVTEAVNECGSVEYDYDTEDDAIRATISKIITSATCTYNQNIAEHNAVVLKLFKDAYNAAKTDYNDYTFKIDEYAGYKHALDNNGVSAYDKAIKDAQAKIFELNTKLVEQYNLATTAFTGATTYVDKEQAFKKEVVILQGKLEGAYNAFLAETQTIATKNNYAQPLTDLADYYNDAKSAIEAYDIIKGITLDPTDKITLDEKKAAAVDAYFDVTDLESAYNTAANVNKGPQQLDALRAQVETQTANVLTAWNNAAKNEAEAAVEVAEKCLKDYQDKTYPTGYTNANGQTWEEILKAEGGKIFAAKYAIYSNKELPGQLATIKSNLEAVATTLAAEESALLGVCQKFIDAYNANAKTINGISDKVAGYKNPPYAAYAADLAEFITAAEDSVKAAQNANLKAFNELSTDATKVDNAITAAQTALDTLVDVAKDLVEANQPVNIVKTLLAKAQELVPLYNRAEANAKGESGSEDAVTECEAIYKELDALLKRLNLKFDSTDPAVLEKIENEANAQQTTKETIENLRQRIINADVEQQKYNALLEELNGENGVKASLGNVKTYIENSTFKTELNEAFSERIAALDTDLLAALTQINIDHANNLCDKTDAVFKGFTAISESITALDNEVKAKAGELQTAKDHAEMRAKNTVNYEAARDAIANADNKLQAEWFNAQESFKDVFTLFNERVKELRSNIATLQDNLTDAYNTAQNEGGVPSDLNTDAYTAKAEEYSDNITNLMGEISKCQTQFAADVTSLNKQIEAMKADFAAIKISDVAAANEDVKKDKAVIETAISNIDKKMLNFGPLDTETVQGLIDAANARITAFAELVAGKTYVPGDITGTGSVDINDTFEILDLILKPESVDKLDEKAQKAADMDGDRAFTVADLVQITNLYVYGTKTGPQGSNRVAAAADAEVGSIDMQLDTDRMSVLLDSNTGYSAIQMDVEMPQGVSINEVNFAGDSQKVMVATNTLENGVQRIVIYSTDGSSILNGESSLINLGLAGEGMGIVSIDNIIASTAAGQRHNLMGVTGAYTIVTGIEATETAEGTTSVFDINGMVRKTVQKGVNIVKDAAGKVKKMLMK
ncbi:MAG: hypothetical protein ACI382_08125 [Alloprevotella sp.]